MSMHPLLNLLSVWTQEEEKEEEEEEGEEEEGGDVGAPCLFC